VKAGWLIISKFLASDAVRLKDIQKLPLTKRRPKNLVQPAWAVALVGGTLRKLMAGWSVAWVALEGDSRLVIGAAWSNRVQ
jgi:hypothetical protein